MNAAIRVELTKLARSTVGGVASAAIVGGILALCGGMMLALLSDDPQLTAKLGPTATLDWAGLTAMAAQITGAGGLLAFGVVASWMFGREFADGTITGLFGLPVTRATIAGAKLVVYAAWAVGVSGLTAAALVMLGLLMGFGTPDAADAESLGRLVTLGVLSAGIALPAAWAATVARSLLGGVSVAIGLVVMAQVSVVAGAGAWMPLAAPTLWAMSAGDAATGAQLSVTVAVITACAVAVIWTWRRLQLDR